MASDQQSSCRSFGFDEKARTVNALLNNVSDSYLLATKGSGYAQPNPSLREKPVSGTRDAPTRTRANTLTHSSGERVVYASLIWLSCLLKNLLFRAY
ncbi:hypothetical protein L596_001725 [Steinernema carpocapsae]|uniref:Uncharacterized protein n=1 Tax=Steinernema carpocapsae TaxID=34508 RepID=A0A4U8UML2_STECR|nr:hypothetical protein L596_001725 [Steinernema carpocapsae]